MPNHTDPIISIQNLTVHYKGQTAPAVEGVSFDINPGTITTFLGPNGSGKSTLIRSILALIEYQGIIKVFGREVNEVYPQIGYVPQYNNFDASFPMTVAEFIELSLINSSHPAEWRQKQVSKTLRQINSTKLADKPISTLSGGQLQRALLARSIVHNPKLLILDEPEAGIDVGTEQSFYETILELVKEFNITAVIASHELDVVYNYADRVICINQHLVADGPPAETLTNDIFEELYGRHIKLVERKTKDS